MLRIGLSLSGGGYRAAFYHLGVLMYLERIQLNDGSSLLDHVVTLSSVSGGSITALWYMMNEKNHINRSESFTGLYHRMISTNFPEILISSQAEGQKHFASLVKQLANLYDDVFFNGEKFGEIMDAVENIGIKHFSANASDFQNGLPFRFQATKRLSCGNNKFSYGYIGNKYYRVDRDFAREIRLADILAASSCFPGAFEPIVFPTDFSFKCRKTAPYYQHQEVGLMDGGIVDNLGLDAIFRFEEQMEKEIRTEDCCHDFVIASDVSDSKVKGYVARKPLRQCKSKISRYYKFTDRIWKGSGIVLLLSVLIKQWWLSGMSAVTLLVGFCARKTLTIINRFATNKLNDLSDLDLKPDFLWKSKLGWLIPALENRVSSLTKMSASVVMAFMRRQMLKLWHTDSKWNNRRVHNAIYALSTNGSWRRMMTSEGLGKKFRPSDQMMIISDEAAAMGTTLWFSENDLRNNLPQKLFACGQYTTCWNLYRYITKVSNPRIPNLNQEHALLKTIGKKVKDDWKLFNDNPLFMAQTQ